jgi:arylsulfatase
MIVTAGGRFGGYGLYVRDNTLCYVHNVCGIERHTLVSQAPLPTGRSTVSMTFTADRNKPGSGGRAILRHGPKVIGQGHIPRTVPFLYSYTETFDVGLDTGTPVDETYACPFAFGGTIYAVEVDVLDDLNDEDRMGEAIAIQRARQDNE